MRKIIRVKRSHPTGPTQIRIYGKVGHLFEENYFFSDGMTISAEIEFFSKWTLNSNWMYAEPGFYEENEFGIRLESVLRVVRKTFEVIWFRPFLNWFRNCNRLNYNSVSLFVQHGGDSRFLGFEVVTLVPFELNLILPEMMTHKQVNTHLSTSKFLSSDSLRFKEYTVHVSYLYQRAALLVLI